MTSEEDVSRPNVRSDILSASFWCLRKLTFHKNDLKLFTFSIGCLLGPEEDLPRKMEYLEFVCHAPSEYFKSRSSPFPTVPTRPEKGYIWTHVGPTPAITIKETVANHL